MKKNTIDKCDPDYRFGEGGDTVVSIDADWQRDKSEDWPEPTPLPAGLSSVTAFNADMLPDAIGPWVSDISERMQCPPDYVGIAALVALGSVLGRKIGIRPQQKTDWIEVPNLWGCIVGRPGDMKSPAMTEALKPLRRLEMAANEKHGEEYQEYKAEAKVWSLKQDAAEARAKAELKKNPDAKVQVASTAEPEEPHQRRYITNDTTYEKLGVLLAQNPNGLLAYRDEIVSLLKTLDRDDNAGARGFYLTAWNGTQPYKFDRIIRGVTHIEAACLSMLGSTQPGKIAEYIRRANAGGAGDDGLIQRFGLLAWPDQRISWKNVDEYPDSAIRQVAWEAFGAFDSMRPQDVSAKIDVLEAVPFLRFDASAQGAFTEWRGDLEALIQSDDTSPAIASHLAKYRKLVPTLALINHLADCGHGPVGEVALLKAMAFSEYLKSHAVRVYGAGPEAESLAAKSILSHIRRRDLVEGFSARDAHRPRWSNLTDHGQVQAGLDLLCEYDWLRPVALDTGGRPKVAYQINPRAL